MIPERKQLGILAVVGIAIIGCTFAVHLYNPKLFPRVLGDFSPTAAAALFFAVGYMLLNYLQTRGWFLVYKAPNRQGLLFAAGFAALFGIVAIPMDMLIVFPSDINVPLPDALLFYPLVGLFAEVAFHLLPLALVLSALSFILKDTDSNKYLWIGILAVATIEPLYQTAWMVSLDRYAAWAVVYDAAHVFAINLAQLIAFRRYDFVSMVALRFIYYLFWHIGWGHFRLYLLF